MTSAPKPWSDLRRGLRDEVAAAAGEIHTFDRGLLTLVDGLGK
ncbi:hypothetical protein [Mesorhizobium erdmanii]|nr:hypothetical protein [Mesorhizobium erdmanii]